MSAEIEKQVHELYWEQDVNCAGTMLTCLCRMHQIPLERQTLDSTAGLHGAGGFRAQCGLVEGALMFIGIDLSALGKSKGEIASLCYEYAGAFTKKFGSLRCYDLRPGGFRAEDPPHACEGLTCAAVQFTREFLERAQLLSESGKEESV